MKHACPPQRTAFLKSDNSPLSLHDQVSFVGPEICFPICSHERGRDADLNGGRFRLPILDVFLSDLGCRLCRSKSSSEQSATSTHAKRGLLPRGKNLISLIWDRDVLIGGPTSEDRCEVQEGGCKARRSHRPHLTVGHMG